MSINRLKIRWYLMKITYYEVLLKDCLDTEIQDHLQWKIEQQAKRILTA